LYHPRKSHGFSLTEGAWNSSAEAHYSRQVLSLPGKNAAESAETRVRFASPGVWRGIACLVFFLILGVPLERVARGDTPSADLEVIDVHGRTITKSGLNLLDWDGYVANPAVKFFLIPPSDATYPAKAVVTGAEPRLQFDLPSEIGPDGPRKEVVWHQREKLPLYLSIFPDRDGEDEHHRLQNYQCQ
jgi:hypothetical protein